MLCRLIRHVLAQPEVRKVEAGAPWAVGSATQAWNFCGVHSVTGWKPLLSVLQMTRRRSSTAYASTVLTTCVRWSFSRAPLCALLLCRSTSETTRSTTHCEFTHRRSLSSHASFHRTIQNTTNRLVFCVFRINFFFYDFMVLYGMVNVDLYSAIITRVSNAMMLHYLVKH